MTLKPIKTSWPQDKEMCLLAHTVDKDETLITVWAIGKRNDEEVYKLLKRRLRQRRERAR